MKHFEQVMYYRDIEDVNGVAYGVGDYLCIVVLDRDSGESVVQFGDYYHDKGAAKLDGFYKGLDYAGVEYDLFCRDAIAR